MELQIESLSHNLSGVADDAARRAKEEAERKRYKALLLGRQLAGMAKIKAGAKAAAERAIQIATEAKQIASRSPATSIASTRPSSTSGRPPVTSHVPKEPTTEFMPQVEHACLL